MDRAFSTTEFHHDQRPTLRLKMAPPAESNQNLQETATDKVSTTNRHTHSNTQPHQIH